MKQIIAAAVLAAAALPAFAQDPVWDANKVTLHAQKLDDGIFAVIPDGASEMAAKGLPIATSGGFVIGNKGVLLIETMLNKRLLDQVLVLVAAETDKPVRWAVNTSYHGDHSYGNAFLPEGVEIIQHVNAAAYIQKHFAEDTAFMIQNFGAGRGIEEVTPTKADILVGDGGSLTLNLGGIAVDIRDYGFAQTGGDLFVSVPSANVLWTGNPIVANAPALPWLLAGHVAETRDTLARVLATVDDKTRVVPGHGPVTDKSAIQWATDYLSELETDVAKAKAEGLTLDQTVAKVQMPDFGGYALKGWVHKALNVPAAYREAG